MKLYTNVKKYVKAGMLLIVVLALVVPSSAMVLQFDRQTNKISAKTSSFSMYNFIPDGDTYIDQWSPTSNYGGQPQMVTRYQGSSDQWELDVMLYFDVGAIPSGSPIASATVNLYYYSWNDNDPVGRNLNMYRALNSWEESSVNWNNQPSYTGTATDSCQIPGSTGQWMSWDVTDDVQAFVDGDFSNYGWIVMDEDDWPFGNIPMTYFYQKEYGSYIPYLEVETSEPQEDTKPPITRLVINEPYYIDEDGYTWISSDTTFSLIGSDNSSYPDSANTRGVYKTYYMVDYEAPEVYTGPFDLSYVPPDTEHVIFFWSVDASGNSEIMQEYGGIVLDDTPPELLNEGFSDLGDGNFELIADYIDSFPGGFLPFRGVDQFREAVSDVDDVGSDQHVRKVVDYEGNAHFVWMNKPSGGNWEILYKQIDPDGAPSSPNSPSRLSNKVLVNSTQISDANAADSMYPSLVWHDNEEVFFNDTSYGDRYALLAAPVRDYIDQEQRNFVPSVNVQGGQWQQFKPTKGCAVDTSGDYQLWIDIAIYKPAGCTKQLNLSVYPSLPSGDINWAAGPNLSVSVDAGNISDGDSWLAFYGKIGSVFSVPDNNLKPNAQYYIIVDSESPYQWYYTTTNDYSRGTSSLGPASDFAFIERYDYPEIWHKHESSMMREYLISEGYSDDNIIFLSIPYQITSYNPPTTLNWRIPYGYYTDSTFTKIYWQPMGYDYASEATWIDNRATHAGLQTAFTQLQNAITGSTEDDLVYIELKDHGGGWNVTGGSVKNGVRPGVASDPRITHDELCDDREECFCTIGNPNNEWDRSYYWFDDEIDIELDKIAYKHMVVNVDTCHSGGFIPDLCGPGRIVVTSGREDETTWSYNYRLYERLDINRCPLADTNSDGKISVREAHYYAASQIPTGFYNQNPQIDIWDNIYVVWSDTRDSANEIYYSKLQSIVNYSATDNGVDLNTPDIRISDDDSYDSGRIVTNTVDGINAEFIEHPDIGVDSDTNLHVVWSDIRNGNWEVFFQKQDNDATPTVLIDDTSISGTSSYDAQCPSLDVDIFDNVHIAWQEKDANGGWEIYYQKQDTDAVVSIDDKLVTTSDGYNSTVPDIAASKRVAVIAFMDDRAIDPGHTAGEHQPGYWEVYIASIDGTGTVKYEKRQSDMKNQSTTYGVYTGNPDGNSMYPKITVSECHITTSPPIFGSTFLTWHDNRMGNWEIYFSQLDSGTHNPSYDNKTTSYAQADMYPDIAIDRFKEPDIKWQKYVNGDWDLWGTTWNIQSFIRIEFDPLEWRDLIYERATIPLKNTRQTAETYNVVVSLDPGVHTVRFHAFNGLYHTYSVDYEIDVPFPDILPGDANGDDSVNVGDAVFLINYVFKGGPAPDPLCCGDANGDETVNVGDAVYLINYVFKGGPPPDPDACDPIW